ncbi:hypothetical protein GCM10007053_26280 [Halioglobus pacificus]|uniref:Uncharacterized protein n=1 Tax=Parahalioglobus pacificus TaxID=930806 RepID=A0A918XL50_9GAMM|nr:hypothetical protein GCM10007053_26280 [Halioglobus pacificus]
MVLMVSGLVASWMAGGDWPPPARSGHHDAADHTMKMARELMNSYEIPAVARPAAGLPGLKSDGRALE